MSQGKEQEIAVDPTAVFMIYEGTPITYGQFADRVRRRATRLRPWQGSTIALWADSGPDFVVNLFAIWQVDGIPLLVSRRLPWAVAATLIRTADAGVVVTPDPGACAGEGLIVVSSACRDDAETETDRRLDTDLPSVGGPGKEVALILHTTGTTRLPKLVRITRANLSASLDLLQQRWGETWRAEDACLGILPLYHVYGVCGVLLLTYRRGSKYVFCAAQPGDIVESLQRHGAAITRLFAVPWTLQQLLETTQGTHALRQLRYVVVGGAVLGEALGEQLTAAGIHLVQGHGMTELGTAFMGELDGGDWRDMTPVIPPEYWHLEVGTGQLIVHADCPTLSLEPPRDFATGDLFCCMPAGRYRFVSRVDDILVHSTGEKSNALVIEQLLLERVGSLIETATVVGEGRLRLAAILLWRRPATADDHQALRHGIADVNAKLPAHSRLQAQMLLHLPPEQAQRLPRTAKKTVARSKAADEFRDELDRLHASGACPEAGATIESFFDRPHELDPEVSLFDQGLDSLDAAALGAYIAGLHPDRDLPHNLVYRYPTLSALKGYLEGQVVRSREPPVFPPYRRSRIAHANRNFRPPRRILLTGATGFIGRHLLEELLRSGRVEHVHCPIRRPAADPLRDPRVTYHAGYDFADARLGLAPHAHDTLLAQVDTVIHAAWPIDFNAPYDRLAGPALASVRNLIEFARHGDKGLHFLSSVATMMLHPTKSRVDEEWPLPSAVACVPIGYAQTKWEAEHELLRSGVRHKIYRLAEISAHSTSGAWNERDHICILLEASRVLGCVPTLPQPIDWVPVDIACRSLLELMTVPGLNVHHIANPRARLAGDVSFGMPSTSLANWLALARPQVQSHPRLAALWPFLHALVGWSERIRVLNADATCTHSPTLAACPPISDDYLRRLVQGRR